MIRHLFTSSGSGRYALNDWKAKVPSAGAPWYRSVHTSLHLIEIWKQLAVKMTRFSQIQ